MLPTSQSAWALLYAGVTSHASVWISDVPVSPDFLEREGGVCGGGGMAEVHFDHPPPHSLLWQRQGHGNDF